MLTLSLLKVLRPTLDILPVRDVHMLNILRHCVFRHKSLIPKYSTSLLKFNITGILQHLSFDQRASCDSGFSSLNGLQSFDSDKFTVCVEGNIGVGKSTFLEQIRKTSSDIEIHPEPVALWKNIKGYNALELMYKDPERWSLAFQSYVQLTMMEAHTAKQFAPTKLMERSLFSARYCFVENLHKSGKLADFDYHILNEWYEWIISNQKLNVDLIVYLRSSPETCLERIIKRSRTEESGVPLEYLESLHQLHEDWLIKGKFPHPKAPVLIMDADKGLEEFKLDIQDKVPQILQCNY